LDDSQPVLFANVFKSIFYKKYSTLICTIREPTDRESDWGRWKCGSRTCESIATDELSSQCASVNYVRHKSRPDQHEDNFWEVTRVSLCIISVLLSIRLAYSRIFHPCYLLPIFQHLNFSPSLFWPHRIIHSRIFSRHVSLSANGLL